MMNRFCVAALVLVSGLALPSMASNVVETQPSGEKAAPTKNIVEVAVGAGTFKTLVAAVTQADLAKVLSGKGPFTVFAPNDEAFAKLPAGTVETLLKPENKAKLVSILTYHVVPAQVLAKAVTTSSAATVNGQQIDLVVKDSKVTVDGANVIATDVMASNGVIHVIDKVILPSEKNIVQTAVEAKTFKTLALLLEKAELVDALSGDKALTVFAPTDEAFAKLPKDVVDSLLKPENKARLQEILKFHVIAGRAFSPAVVGKGWEGVTLQGSSLKAKVDGETVTINGSKVLKTDIDASNGVIHVIDTVLLPQ